MKAVLTDDRFSEDGWIFERKLDGIRCLASKAESQVWLRSRNDLSLNGRFPEVAEALAQDAATDFVIDGEVVAFAGLADQLRAAPAARRAAGGDLLLRLRPAPPRRPRHDRAPAARAQVAAPARAVLARPAAALLAPQPRRRGLLPRGVREGLGGADRQARRRALHARPLARLAQVQVLGRAGAGRSAASPPRAAAGPTSARCCSATSRTGGCATRARSGPASRRRSCATSRGSSRRSPAPTPRSRTRSASAT